MSLFNDKPTQLAVIIGKYVASGGFTDVIGGTLTAGTCDVGGSATITWAPAMISAPSIMVCINSGLGTNTTSISDPVISAVTVSNANFVAGGTPASGATYAFMIIGQARL